MAVNFPNSPLDGQIFFDTTTGNRYMFDAATSRWKRAANSNPYVDTSDTQVLFNNNGSIDGVSGLTFNSSANTLTANTINAYSMRVTGNLYIGSNTVVISNNSISAQTLEVTTMVVGGSAIPTGQQSNAVYDVANAGFGIANAAYTATNSVFGVANAAFNSANNVAPQVAPAYNTANGGYTIANASYGAINSAFGVVNAVFGQSNSEVTRLSAAYVVSNAAFGSANGKVSKSGDTITGTLSIVGDLVVSGNTYQLNANTMSVSDPLIYLAANNYASDIVDIGFIANYVNTGGANVHTGLYREHTDKEYYLFQGYDREPINNHIGALSNNMTLSVLNADIRTSNLNLGGANTITWISSGYGVANAAYGQANTLATSANAYAAAVGTSTNNYTSATYSTLTQFGSVFGVANAAYGLANSDSTKLSAAYAVANAAFGAANGSSISGVYTVANAAFGKANTAVISDQYGSFKSTFTANIDANIDRTSGAYGSYAAAATNTPTNSGILYNFTSGTTGSGDGGQFWVDYSTNNLYSRKRWGGGWSTWQTYLSASNYNSYAPTLTGTGASGSWGISVTGSSGSVSGLTITNNGSGINPDNVTQNQIGYNTSVSLFGQSDGGLYSSAYSSSWIHQIYGDFRTGQIAIRGKNNGTWQSWYYVPSYGYNNTSYSGALYPTIVYDTNNTAYYVDPTGTSVFGGQIQVKTGTAAAFYVPNISAASDYTYVMGAANDGGNKLVMFINGSARSADGGTNAVTIRNDAGNLNLGHGSYETKLYGQSRLMGSYLYVNTTGNFNIICDQGPGSIYIGDDDIVYLGTSASARTPILYDYNNTGYYVDPASTSNLNVVSMAGDLTFGTNSGYGINLYGGNTGAHRIYLDSYWTIFKSHSNEGWKFRDNGNTDMVTMYGASGNITAGTYYDRNDTGYYVNPNGTSVLSTLYHNGGTAYFRGGQGVDQCCGDDGAVSIGGNSTKPPRIAWHSAGIMEGTIEGNATGWRKIYFYDQQAVGLGIHATGQIASNGNVVAYYSDRRLKEDFVRVTDHWNVINNINGYRFTWNQRAAEIPGFVSNVGKREVGLVAQEVLAVYPEAVYTRTEGPEDDPYKTILHDRFNPIFIEALKDLRLEIDELRAEIRELKNGK